MDEQGGLTGEISIEDIRRALLSDKPTESFVARTLARRVGEPLTPEDDLARAAKLLAAHDSDQITVVRDRLGREVIGLFGRRDLIVAYGKHLHNLHGEAEREAEAERRVRRGWSPRRPWRRGRGGGAGGE